MHGKAIGDGPMLTRAARAERVFGDACAGFQVARRLECTVLADDALVEFGALLDVGLHEELGPGREETGDLGEEDVPHHQALGVLLLPPGVWEVEVDARNDTFGTEARQREPRVLAKDARACTVALLGEALVTDGRPLLANLEADEARSVRRDRALDQEAGLRARTDFELQRCAAHDLPQIDEFTVGKARRGVVGAGLAGRRTSVLARCSRLGHVGRIDARAQPVKVC